MPGGGGVSWDEDVETHFLKACEEVLNFNAKRDLERRVRSGTGTEDKARLASSCCDQSTSCSGQASSDRAAHGSCSSHKQGDSGKQQMAEDEDERKFDTIELDLDGERGGSDAPPTGKYVFKKDDGDRLGELLDSWMTPRALSTVLVEAAERAAGVYSQVMAKGKQDGLEMPGQKEERQLRRDILKETLLRIIQGKVHQQLRAHKIAESREGGLLANPGGYKDGPLDTLLPETMRDLMGRGYALQSGFLGPLLRAAVYEDCELLEFDGQFNEVLQQQKDATRTDSMCWITLSDLDRQKHRGLIHLFRRLTALPYELNKKANLFLQAAWTLQLACYPSNGSYYTKHIDGGYSAARNNGQKVTCIYYPNEKDWSESDGGYLRMYPRRSRDYQLRQSRGGGDNAENKARVSSGSTDSSLPISRDQDGKTRGEGKHRCEETEEQVAYDNQHYVDLRPASDTLLLFRSRDMPHEVLRCYRKRFAITLWITGPEGPGDDD